MRRVSTVAAGVALTALMVPAAFATTSFASNVHAAKPHAANQKAPKVGILYTFDQGSSGRSGTLVRDSLGHRQPGRVLSANGGQLTTVHRHGGNAVRFPAPCLDRGCARVVLRTHNAHALNPGWHPFAFGALVRVAADRTAKTSTIIQKGEWQNPHGRFRLRINSANAKPYCLVKGNRGLLRMHSPTGIADGTWHAISCVRRDGRVSIIVDGAVAVTKTGPTGFVRTGAPIYVGGTSLLTKNNQFFGSLDNVRMRVFQH